MILVPFDHALHPRDEFGSPRRVVDRVDRVRESLPVIEEAVSLKVALVDHPQAVLVAQLEEPRVRGIVTRSDGVDVVLLHEQHVAEHGGLVEGTPCLGVELVTVHTTEEDPAPIDGDDAIQDLDTPEADRNRDALCLRAQLSPIEPRQLSRPRLDLAELRGFPSCDIDTQFRDDDTRGNIRIDPEDARVGLRVKVGMHEEVVD